MKKNLEKVYQKILLAYRFILDLLYPPHCPVCDKVALPKDGICPQCRKKLNFISEPFCMKCGKPISDARKEFCSDCGKKTHNFTQGRALWVYGKEVKESLYRFKYQNKREYAGIYAREIAGRHGAWIQSKKIQVIVPVPLHKNRHRKRGFNQAAVLAEELGRILNLPVDKKALIRIRDTKPQKTLSNAERKQNLKHAFCAKQNKVSGDIVLLVDDIYTTGSTLDAAAKALLESGVSQVFTCCVGIGGDVVS